MRPVFSLTRRTSTITRQIMLPVLADLRPGGRDGLLLYFVGFDRFAVFPSGLGSCLLLLTACSHGIRYSSLICDEGDGGTCGML